MQDLHGGCFSVFFSHGREIVYLDFDEEQSLGWVLVLCDIIQIGAQLVYIVESGYGVRCDSAFLVEIEDEKNDDNERGRGNGHFVKFCLQNER